MTGAIEHQAPNEKHGLRRSTSQAISGGQATKRDVGGSLKARRFDHCQDDQEVAHDCENTKRRVNTSCKNIVYEGRTVVSGKGYPKWQATHSGSVALIGHAFDNWTELTTEAGTT